MANQALKKRTKDNAAFRQKVVIGLLVVQIWFAFHRGYLYSTEAFDADFLQLWAYYLAGHAVIVWWLFSSMASENYQKLIREGWTATCYDSMLIVSAAQVLSFATGYALYLLYFVPLLVVVRAVKVCLAAKSMLGNVMGGMGGQGEPVLDEAEQKRQAKKQRQREMRERRAGRR